jgi:formylglycine-generating enzyme required for sulfatase activity
VGSHFTHTHLGVSNVYEWCQDDWHNDYEGAPIDGSAWLNNEEDNNGKLLRGGSWNGNPELCRSAYRYNDNLDYSLNYIGFRVVCSGAART